MLDIIPKWFLLLTLNFLALLFLLNIILYKPLLKLFKEREDTVKDALDGAKDMSNKKEESIARLNRELAEGRNKAKETFEALKAEGLNKQKEMLSAADAEASKMLEKARAEVKAEAEKARKALRADVEKFSDEIVRKLVGI
ncbi:MAG: ATP synthase F0 subunit B [Nitrospirota bacterium]